MLLIVIGIHAQVVESKLLLYPLLECGALLQSQAIGLRNDWHNIDKLGQLLQHDDVNWLQAVTGRLDEEEAAVDAGVLQVSLTLGSELFAEVGAVLVLDVLDDGIPAALVVDEIAVAGGVDDIQSQPNAVLLNDVRHALDLSCAANGLIGLQTALAVHQV